MSERPIGEETPFLRRLDLAEIELTPAGEPVRAEAEPGVVNYYFPVEIEVRAAESVDVEAIIEETLDRLANKAEDS